MIRSFLPKSLFRLVAIALLVALLIVLLGFSALFLLQTDKHKEMSFGFIQSQTSSLNGEPLKFQAGFSAINITPLVEDRWIDANNNAEYEPDKGDSYKDINGNGKFDPVWIAGFGNKRAANGVHDPIWVRTAVFDDGRHRIAIASLDLVGLAFEQVLDIRMSLSKELGVDYLLIASTHNHEGPDTMGIWGGSIFSSGINPDYQASLKAKIKQSVIDAVAALRPSQLSVSQDLHGAAHLLEDTRKPTVLDAGLRMILARDISDNKVLGSLVVWADHPETVWGDNLLISSDFPHYVRETIEQGIHTNQMNVDGIGGTSIYLNGAIGGLMTTSPRVEIVDPLTGETYLEPSFAKAEAQGTALGILALNSLENEIPIDKPEIHFKAQTIQLPIENPTFILAFALGLADKDFVAWNTTRSEVASIRIGPISIATIPGEIYPEIVNGGIESPPGQDYKIPPLEIPPIRDMMSGQYKFVIGLANDEVGYIIPKSEWDETSPYLYHAEKSPYGETNSYGSDTAFIIHKALKTLLKAEDSAGTGTAAP